MPKSRIVKLFFNKKWGVLMVAVLLKAFYTVKLHLFVSMYGWEYSGGIVKQLKAGGVLNVLLGLKLIIYKEIMRMMNWRRTSKYVAQIASKLMSRKMAKHARESSDICVKIKAVIQRPFCYLSLILTTDASLRLTHKF